ncbi:transmembrane protease serine 9-like [Phlebotomus argentipes]|uniref:transmembrane protease serine 9-like n=1 Tax=Phlebotomus argentipes TaxID=94469 RepID=UPI00289351D3|nr:transmembrane protease serine 9-like [Phlebotomus argentipes]
MLRIVVFASLVIAVLGNEAASGQFPHHASWRDIENNRHFCGGILVNNRWIVSSGECTLWISADNSFIVLGALSRTTGGTKYDILRIIVHPHFDSTVLHNDVSLVQTVDEIIFTNNIKPITLGSVFVGGGVSALFSGYATDIDALQFTRVTTLTNNECAVRLGPSGLFFSAHKICSVIDEGNLCIMERGGAMIVANQAVAIGSMFGRGCFHSTFPELYERVSDHRNWIPMPQETIPMAEFPAAMGPPESIAHAPRPTIPALQILWSKIRCPLLAAKGPPTAVTPQPDTTAGTPPPTNTDPSAIDIESNGVGVVLRMVNNPSCGEGSSSSGPGVSSQDSVALGKAFPTPHDFISGNVFPPGIGSRVVGGSTASPGQFPYQASLRFLRTQEHFCGAVLVNNLWLLCAAHCTQFPASDFYLLLGAHFRASGTRYDIAQIVNHPQYNANTIAFDVSVIRTMNPVAFSNTIQPIPMGSAFVGGGVTAVLSGWGLTSSPGSLAAELQFLNVQTHTNDECRSRMGGNANMIFDHKICAGGVQGQGACSADSGGPLAVGNTVIGIVSWGIPCARGFPDAYDRVSYHRSWFLQYIESN